MAEKMIGYILYTIATTEINRHPSRNGQFRYIDSHTKHISDAKDSIYNRTHNMLKLIHYRKYTSKGSELLGFYLYLWHVGR